MPHFDAQTFIERLDAGAYDTRLTEEIQQLTHDQLLEICRILAERQRAQHLSTGA